MAETRSRNAVISTEQIDYSRLVGFVPAAERIDPHVHVAVIPAAPNLREMVEIVRTGRRENHTWTEKQAATATE